MKKSNAGRPTKKTENTIRKLEEMFHIDCTIEEACLEAWIDPVTYHDWMNNDKIFSNRIGIAKNRPFIEARHTLVIWAKTDAKMAVELLKRRDRRYKDKSEEEVLPQIVIDMTGKSMKDIEEMRKQLLS